MIPNFRFEDAYVLPLYPARYMDKSPSAILHRIKMRIGRHEEWLAWMNEHVGPDHYEVIGDRIAFDSENLAFAYKMRWL